MLALRNYKKPELYSRIKSGTFLYIFFVIYSFINIHPCHPFQSLIEGCRDRDTKLIGTLLKTISSMRDNAYILNRYIWNDVHEDWPFYSEQERQCLKRRKPQNLTPPLSSDGGSSTSGQSPTSTHNGSPPPPVKRPSMNNEKYSEGPNAKKTRISHCQSGSGSGRLDNYASANDYVKASAKHRRGVESRESSSALKSRSRDSQMQKHQQQLHGQQQGGGDVDSPMRASSGYYRLVWLFSKRETNNIHSPNCKSLHSSSSVTPNSNAAESSAEENGLHFTVLSSDVAVRIAPSEPSVTIGSQQHQQNNSQQQYHQQQQQPNQQQQQSVQFNGNLSSAMTNSIGANDLNPMDSQPLRMINGALDTEKYDFR